ncbi:MAG TPA: PVC-type heme-binding CxxCH protein [Tepidisphaeraceae bacterium]|nr:PVC-type heme-binding CxxCH protein [Tepidisphaeraceae bacterium]
MRILLPFVVALVLAPFALAQSHPIPPNEAASHMTVPAGFHVSLFAGEPDLVQPISFCFDDRGRLWVIENFSYPNWQTTGTEGHDRILIFEDPNASGHFTKRTVFCDKGMNLSGIEVGFGGVWLCSTPNLIFIPFNDGEDRPSGPPKVILDGWSLEAKHNVFNRLVWGPDGWLYGCNGILATSDVGKPGDPPEKRTLMNCGVWRYHPIRGTFEVVARGTTNPWGLDFDDMGQMFITNCVIKHLWHVIPGAHYQRMYGEDFDPNLYGLMESIADHIHWAGGDWTTSRTGAANSAAGGGHAHAGAMVYLGDNWPDTYRNTIFMCNIHGNRVNNDILEDRGSGYVGHHGKDFLLANDPWFRGLNLEYGPDGGVFLSDWCDTGECHNYLSIDRSNGRIYKIVYGSVTPQHPDLAKLDDSALVQLQLHKNDWWVRHARRLLEERFAAGTLKQETRPALLKMLHENPDVTRQLRALWALQSTGGIDPALTQELLSSKQEYVRSWAIQLALEDGQASQALLQRLAEMAKSDPSPVVRLALASGLQRLPDADRWAIAEALVAHGEDANDLNLPLMYWYAIEPLVPKNPARAGQLAVESKIPTVRQYIARRLASLPQ